MSSATPRWIIVDDEDPLIQYQGPWSVGDGNTDSPGHNVQSGDPFDNTVHGISGSGSFTFNFTGSSVIVRGSFSNVGAPTLPSWKCFINGLPIPSSSIPTANSSNWDICGTQAISTDAPSNLTVTASGTTDSPFLFDCIQYIPGATVALNNATVMVGPSDTQIHYSPEWSGFDNLVGTESPGSSMIFDFIGVQIEWMSVLIGGWPTSNAQYSIDGTTPIPFEVKSPVEENAFNQVGFKTSRLTPGRHRLYVEYGGDHTTAPLVLECLIIWNLTAPPSTPSPASASSSALGSATSHHAGLAKGAIAGIVIGLLVGLALVIIGLVWARRQKLAAPALFAKQAKKAKKVKQDSKDKVMTEP